jgi:cell wall-associated NlpC family hydrolase
MSPSPTDPRRAAVIAEASTWLRTPYYWLSDKKGIGVDCAMLLVRCFVDTGVLEPFDPRPYPVDWHLHHSDERYLGWLTQFGPETTTPQPGDVAVLRFGRCFSHGAILVTPSRLIHAYLPHGRVLMADLHEPAFRNRPMKFFDPYKGLA